MGGADGVRNSESGVLKVTELFGQEVEKEPYIGRSDIRSTERRR